MPEMYSKFDPRSLVGQRGELSYEIVALVSDLHSRISSGTQRNNIHLRAANEQCFFEPFHREINVS